MATRAARQQSHGGSPQARRTFQRTGEAAARAFEQSLPPSVAFARPSSSFMSDVRSNHCDVRHLLRIRQLRDATPSKTCGRQVQTT